MPEGSLGVACAGNEYAWLDDWAKIPRTDSAKTGWAHHGIVVSDRRNEVLTFHQSDRAVLALDLHGNLLRRWQTDLVEGHGMTLVEEGGEQYLWIADNGSKRRPDLNYEYPPEAAKTSGQVVKMDLSGNVLTRLTKPSLPQYRETRFAPTSVAVDEEAYGGTGRVFVADGYGSNLVHAFDGQGNLEFSFDGAKGAGAFSTPHSVYIDRRKPEAELYVADRANRRVQVFDLDGGYRRTFGSEFLSSPSGFAVYGDLMFVAELRARVAVLDGRDHLLGYLGSNEGVAEKEGWPNAKDAQGRVVRTDRLEPGLFNSPHGIAADKSGNIYVAEWLIGGRIVKLGRSSQGQSGREDVRATKGPQ